MISVLIHTGLVLVTFYELIFKLFPNVEVIMTNTRDHRSMLSMCLALGIGLLAAFNGELKKCSNRWILFFFLAVLASILFSPQFTLVVNDNDSTNFWVWKPALMMLSYLLMFLAVQSMNIKLCEVDKMLRVAMYCGLVMAVYVIIQRFFSDQFYYVKTRELIGTPTNPQVVGTLGNATIVAPYIAMLIPLSIYLKKYFYGVVMVIAVLLCDSVMATGALFIALCFYLVFSNARLKILIFAVLVLVLTTFLFVKTNQNKEYFDNNGRMVVWRGIVTDMVHMEFGDENKHPYLLTGLGPEGYSYVYNHIKKSVFREAHNEPLEIFVNHGLVGLVVFLIAVMWIFASFFYNLFWVRGDLYLALFSAFLVPMIVSLGTFIFQVSPHNFYTVLFLGLLYNQQLIKEYIDE